MRTTAMVVITLLAGCSDEDPGVTGAYAITLDPRATIRRDLFATPTVDNMPITRSQPLTGGWNVEYCGDGEIAVEVLVGCGFRAKMSGGKAVVIANHRCEIPDENSKTWTEVALSGELTFSGDNLSGTLVWDETLDGISGYTIATATNVASRKVTTTIERPLCDLGTPGAGIVVKDFSALGGCSSYTNLSAASADRTITFDITAFTPRCIEVSPGQSVTFKGDFASCQLYPGLDGNAAAGAPGSSIGTFITGTTRTVTMPSREGDYVFHCHAAGTTTGLVRVRNH